MPTRQPSKEHVIKCAPVSMRLDDRVARKQVGGREQIEGKKSEVTEDE